MRALEVLKGVSEVIMVIAAVSNHEAIVANREATGSNVVAGRQEQSGPQYRSIVGHSEPWKHVLKRARQVSPTEATVLLSGESGTGKEVVARLIHRTSPRRRAVLGLKILKMQNWHAGARLHH